jgi:hypothetical protein
MSYIQKSMLILEREKQPIICTNEGSTLHNEYTDVKKLKPEDKSCYILYNS